MILRGGITQKEIAGGLRRLSVEGGCALLVHSSLSSFGLVAGGAEAVIEALRDAAGPTGTVAVPTHTWDRINARNPVFDVRNTPCCVGLIPETFRKRPDALRGLHPTHSCAAVGPMAGELLQGHETQDTPCGTRSPYQRLMQCGGMIAFLGIDLRVNTSIHALEEMAELPWLFDRTEMLYSVDCKGKKVAVPSRRHAGDMSRAFEKAEPILARAKAIVRGRIGRAEVRVVDAAKMKAALLPLLIEDPCALLEPEAARRARRRSEGS
ncbi:MAG: AAC(3) family N-acetyltransferase [Planctomycetota bacterium]|jgi:aminoglycoside 3-N-acetyltransferase